MKENMEFFTLKNYSRLNVIGFFQIKTYLN